MSELEFLMGEARIASASAPSGLAVTVRGCGKTGRFDVLVGGRIVARFLERPDALACIMGAGGAFAALAGARKKDESVTVIDRFDPRWKKRFKSRRSCREWIMDGLAATEGAEQEHFSRMLLEFEGGANVLHYN